LSSASSCAPAGTKAEIGARFGHRQLDRPVAEHLQDQRAIELDVGVHQAHRRAHLAQQAAHLGRERVTTVAGRGATRQQLAPAEAQLHQHAAHR
jgi:hypothetical protein